MRSLRGAGKFSARVEQPLMIAHQIINIRSLGNGLVNVKIIVFELSNHLFNAWPFHPMANCGEI